MERGFFYDYIPVVHLWSFKSINKIIVCELNAHSFHLFKPLVTWHLHFSLFSQHFTSTDLDEFPPGYKGTLHPQRISLCSALCLESEHDGREKIHLSHTWQDGEKDPFTLPCQNNQRRLKLYVADMTGINVITQWCFAEDRSNEWNAPLCVTVT